MKIKKRTLTHRKTKIEMQIESRKKYKIAKKTYIFGQFNNIKPRNFLSVKQKE